MVAGDGVLLMTVSCSGPEAVDTYCRGPERRAAAIARMTSHTASTERAEVIRSVIAGLPTRGPVVGSPQELPRGRGRH